CLQPPSCDPFVGRDVGDSPRRSNYATNATYIAAQTGPSRIYVAIATNDATGRTPVVAAPRARLPREHREIGLRFLDHPRKRRSLRQPLEVRRELWPRVSERHHPARIEQRGRRCAVGHGEGIADGPGMPAHLLFGDRIGRLELRPRLLDPV